MNPIPLIFNQRQLAMTVIGGREMLPDIRMDVAVILLNRCWSSLRVQMIECLMRCGFCQIVSVELSAENYNIENFSRRFPFVKIIIPLEGASDGDLINTAMNEVSAEYVLVLRDTLDFSKEILSSTLASKLAMNKTYCIAPRLLARGSRAFPMLFSPSIDNAVLDVRSTSIVSDGAADLFPFDYIGLYNRSVFIQLGGFDYTIANPYWQNLDLSFRAWLWGERIQLSTAFCMEYLCDVPVSDSSASQFSNRFYLKNLVPRVSDGHGFIPRSSFFVFLNRSSCGFFEALRQFRDARDWVSRNEDRFKYDVLYLLENWGNK